MCLCCPIAVHKRCTAAPVLFLLCSLCSSLPVFSVLSVEILFVFPPIHMYIYVFFVLLIVLCFCLCIICIICATTRTHALSLTVSRASSLPFNLLPALSLSASLSSARVRLHTFSLLLFLSSSHFVPLLPFLSLPLLLSLSPPLLSFLFMTYNVAGIHLRTQG